MTMRALLLSRDAHVLAELRRLLERAGVASEPCSTADEALRRLALGKYEAVVVDGDDAEEAAAVLASLRNTSSNRRAVTLGLTRGHGASIFRLGANFVLEKPLVPDRTARVLRAAHGLMAQERRRYHRFPSDHVVNLTCANMENQRAVMCNLSPGGMALRGVCGLGTHQPLLLRFCLPGEEAFIEAQAETAWSRQDRAGVRFLKLSGNSRQRLDLWLGLHHGGGERDGATWALWSQGDT